MACVENIPPINIDSEREEGEIVDDLDGLSDISSEEEFLLRQRLQVLENYNNVLERKEAKRSSIVSGKEDRTEELLLPDLSEISATDLEDACSHVIYRERKERQLKSYRKPHKRRKESEPYNNTGRSKDYNKKKSHRNKKRIELKVISESSEESDDEYRNKRRKLADAVVVNKTKNDMSTLKARISKMLSGKPNPTLEKIIVNEKEQINESELKKEHSNNDNKYEKTFTTSDIKEIKSITNDLPTDNVVKICDNIEYNKDDVDAGKENKTVDVKNKSDDSDEDLELLRQHALKTKSAKVKPLQLDVPIESEVKAVTLSDDEDSDTAELRLICLKSALLKKAIERKQKQKLIKKRLSQSSNWQEEFMEEQEALLSKSNSENNTDIESVDMDIGSDADEKTKEQNYEIVNHPEGNEILEIKVDNGNELRNTKEDELEEDEDLLRAKLLTSLSKNLPHLLDPKIIDEFKTPEKLTTNSNHIKNMPEEKKFIINLGESDSEGEHEATENLTKMHMKLSESLNFEQKLDLFLKSTRMKVENGSVPDNIPPPVAPVTPLPKPTTEKFVPKAVNHLPKSEQIEYKSLVKRMTELEKMRQARQSSLNLVHAGPIIVKDTLKPRNVSVDAKLPAINNLDEQIALSRKKIAEESAKMLQLREEAKKLSQKYKIVATELRNITTAISLNKKQQRAAQNRLSKIRAEHHKLLDSSNSVHSKHNGLISNFNRPMNKVVSNNKLQKENNPAKDEYKNVGILKSVKVSVVNDFKHDDKTNSKLSVQIDVNSNKKIVKMPKSPNKNRFVDINTDTSDLKIANEKNSEVIVDNVIHKSQSDVCVPVEEKGGGTKINSIDIMNTQVNERKMNDLNDYKSPLQALASETWKGDPNAVLCPFEIGGSCRDTDCKYLHLKIFSEQ